jgi:hypothetical protein
MAIFFDIYHHFNPISRMKVVNQIFSGDIQYQGSNIAGTICGLMALACGLYLFFATKSTFYQFIIDDGGSTGMAKFFSFVFTALLYLASYAMIYLIAQSHDPIKFFIGIIGQGMIMTVSCYLLYSETMIGFGIAILFVKTATTYGTYNLTPTILHMTEGERVKIGENKSYVPYDETYYNQKGRGKPFM